MDYYIECLNKMEEYEAIFNNGQEQDALYKMIDLYAEIVDTTVFHDIVDSIEIWLSKYADTNLINYIHRKNYKNLNRLIKTIEFELNNS